MKEKLKEKSYDASLLDSKVMYSVVSAIVYAFLSLVYPGRSYLIPKITNKFRIYHKGDANEDEIRSTYKAVRIKERLHSQGTRCFWKHSCKLDK